MPGCMVDWSNWSTWEDKLEGHHILPKRYLKRVAKERRLSKEETERLLWSLANHMTLCGRHHNRHERALERVPAEVVPTRAWAFAESVGLTWVLGRIYDDRGADPIRNLARGA